MSIFKQGCQKTGPLKYGVVGVGTLMKNWVSHILFLRKGGLIIYLAALKRGLFAPHIRILSYIGSYPPPEVDSCHKVWSLHESLRTQTGAYKGAAEIF